jgi:hypothetical protein
MVKCTHHSFDFQILYLELTPQNTIVQPRTIPAWQRKLGIDETITEG